MTDPWIPFMVGCAWVAACWTLCKLAQLAFIGLQHRQERLARKKEIAAYGTAEAARRQHQNTLARAIRHEDRRELSARVKSDMDRRGYTAHDIYRFVEAVRPSEPKVADRARSQGGLGISDESGLGYALPRVGGDGDRAA